MTGTTLQADPDSLVERLSPFDVVVTSTSPRRASSASPCPAPAARPQPGAELTGALILGLARHVAPEA